MKDQKPTPFKSWLETLSPGTRRCLSGGPAGRPGDEAEEYGAWRDTLSDGTKERVDSSVDTTQPVPADEDTQQYILVECEAEAFPLVRVFRDPFKMAKYIGKLAASKRDISVVICRGEVLRLTTGEQRYMTLPGSGMLLSIPPLGVGKPQEVDMGLLGDVEYSDDGYIGPPEYLMEEEKGAGTGPLVGEVMPPDADDPGGAEVDG